MPSDVRVALLEDQGDGTLFFADLCRMLELLAERSGLALALLEAPSASSLPCRIYRCSGALPEALRRELGSHRAQIVPRDSSVGRVMTSRVAVLDASKTMEPPPPVIKTYNYVQARVTRHETGERLALDDVLAGRV